MCIALKAAMILAPFLLQQPSGKPNYKANSGHMTRRLQLWKEARSTSQFAKAA